MARSVYTIAVGMYDCEIKEGNNYILISKVNELNERVMWKLLRDNGKGVPGNIKNDVCSYHGWRGTTNNIATYAHGLRRVEKVISRKEDSDVEILRVKLGPDITPRGEEA